MVESQTETQRWLGAMLQDGGYSFDAAPDSVTALQKVFARRYDAIVMNVALPRQSAWEFRATVLADPQLARIPTIVVTPRALPLADSYRLRTPHVLQTPFGAPALLSALRRACAASSVEPTNQLAATRQRAMRSNPSNAFGLLWSRRGAVACAEHAPAINSSEWVSEGWAPIPGSAFGRHGVMYQCEDCHGTPIRRSGSRA